MRGSRRPHALLLLAALCAVGSAKADDGDDVEVEWAVTYGKAKKLCSLADERITESSGVACGRENPELFWTHNDSGNGPQLFAFDKTGRTHAVVVLSGAAAVDWEDIASVTLWKKGFLLVADTGNNDRDRTVCKLYLVPEPGLKGISDKPRSVEVAATLPFKYPEGAQDCEAIAVDAANARIYLATREDHKNLSRVYTLPIPRRTPKEPVVAELVAELPYRKVTAMDMSPDGRRAILISYRQGWEYQRLGNEDWKTTFAKEPRKMKLPKRKQGESVCYGPKGRSLYLTSEKHPSPLWEIPGTEAESK